METAPHASDRVGLGFMAIVVVVSIGLLFVTALAVWMFQSRWASAHSAGGESAAGQTATAGPAPSGQPITVWNATCSGLGGAQTTFGMEYRLDGFKPEQGKKYRWVVSGLAGNVNFDLAVETFHAFGKLSGPVDIRGGQVQGPLTTYIEMDAAGGARPWQISNSAPVQISGPP